MKIPMPAAAAGGLAAVAVAAIGVASLTDLVEPLVPEDEDLTDLVEPLVPEDEDLTDLVEPLVPKDEDGATGDTSAEVPPGANLAEAYWLVVTYHGDAELSGELRLRGAEEAIFESATVSSNDHFQGDLLLTSNATYEGKLLARASGSATTTVFGRECVSAWDGEQTMAATGAILDPTDAATRSYIEPEAGAWYLELWVEPLGTPRYSNPEDCGTYDADTLPFGDERASGGDLSLFVVRLPPPGYGKLIERIGDSVEGIGSYEWVVELTAISREEASPDLAVIDEPPVVTEYAAVDVKIADGGASLSLAGIATEFDSACSIDGFADGLLFNYISDDLNVHLNVMDLEDARSGTDAFSLYLDVFEGDDVRSYEVLAGWEIGSGTATVSQHGDSATVDVVATTPGGEEIDLDLECAQLVP